MILLRKNEDDLEVFIPIRIFWVSDIRRNNLSLIFGIFFKVGQIVIGSDRHNNRRIHRL